MRLLDKKLLKNLDIFTLLLIFLLVMASLVFIANALSDPLTGDESTLAEVLSKLNLHYVWLQLMWFLVGLAVMVIILFADYRVFSDYSKLFYIISVSLLAILLILGKTARGVAGWFTLGERGFQPAELCKITLILSCAKYASKVVEREGAINQIKDILKICVIIGIPVVLVCMQPDYGTALAYICILVGILFTARIKYKYIVVALVLAIIVLPLIYYFVLNSDQQSRISVFLNPASDTNDKAYQVTQAKLAIGSGGLFGKGLFKEGSLASLAYVPDRHTDFIFSVTIEAAGFIFGLILIIVYFSLILRSLYLATKAKDKFGYFLIIGVVSMFTYHVFENIGMNLGIMPVTGIPLPFMSYGGSSMLTNMIAFGIVLNVAMRRQSRR